MTKMFDHTEDFTWFAEGACRGKYGVMYPQRGASTKEAMSLCASCPVQTQCLDYALRHREKNGIWGGVSERQRRQMRKALGPPNREFNPSMCGTEAGYKRHYRADNQPCAACREAHRVYQQAGRQVAS